MEVDLFVYGARYYATWTCRFTAVDPMVSKYPHQSSYAYAANNPTKFVDSMGAEPDTKEVVNNSNSSSEGGGDDSSNTTVQSKHVDAVVQQIEKLSGELEALGEEIKKFESTLNEMEDLDNTNAALGVGTMALGWPGRLAAIVMGADYLMGEEKSPDVVLEERSEQLGAMQEKFDAKFKEYQMYKEGLKGMLDNADAIEFEGGVTYTVAIAVGAAVHLNSNNAQGNYAIYEIELDGNHYKFGIADANRTVKSDIAVQRPDGDGGVDFIKKGTPVRLYQQQRQAIKKGYDVTVKIHEVKTDIKQNIKTLESSKIYKRYLKYNYVGDGNSAHSKKWKVPRYGKYAPNTRRLKRK